MMVDTAPAATATTPEAAVQPCMTQRRRCVVISPGVVLAAGSVVLSLSMGTRHVFGVFLGPVSQARGWGREVFSLAIAMQNLVWGATQPLTGHLADTYGAGWVVAPGSLCLGLGLAMTSYASQPWMLQLSLGLLVGVGLSCLSFAIVFGAIGRRTDTAAQRSQAMGVSTAVTSATQCLLLPLVQVLNARLSPLTTLRVLGLACLAGSLPCALPLLETDLHQPKPTTAPPPPQQAQQQHQQQRGGPSSPPSLRSLLLGPSSRSLWLLSLAFLVCGFHVVFIGTHIAAFLHDQGQPAQVSIVALSLIGLFNVPGTYTAGWAGARTSKTRLLAGVYAVRAVALVSYTHTRVTALSTYMFASLMGLCWLATVPLTNALLASAYGVTHLSFVSGLAFFCHQVGSFLGGWGGGYVYDTNGSYGPIWTACVVGSVVATLLVLMVKEEEEEAEEGASSKQVEVVVEEEGQERKVGEAEA